jgi:hypothetical protein
MTAIFLFKRIPAEAAFYWFLAPLDPRTAQKKAGKKPRLPAS